jgi:hypothetical protein
MKIIILLVGVFSSLFIPRTNAQTDVYNLLVNDEPKNIRQAARIMAKGEQNTPENLDLLALIIEKEFEDAQSNRIDALSWGCKALAASGNSQYLVLLEKIIHSKFAHKKLKKYANQAYQKLLSTENLITKQNKLKTTERNVIKKDYVGQDKNTLRLIPNAALTATERKIFAIAKGEWLAIKSIAQELEATEKPNTRVLDALSQFLMEMHLYTLDSEKIDVLSWICRALGHSNNGRYKLLLQNITTQITNKKLYTYTESASKEIKQTATPYVINSINFQQILDEYMQR